MHPSYSDIAPVLVDYWPAGQFWGVHSIEEDISVDYVPIGQIEHPSYSDTAIVLVDL